MENFLREGLVGFDAAVFGALSPTISKEQLLELYAKHYLNEKQGSRAVWAPTVPNSVR